MRKMSTLVTILITSFVMALAGLVASPIASASENGNGSISATFPLGSSVLTKSQKAAIKNALASSGTDVTYTVTGTAGKLPGVSNSSVQRLAKKRAQAIKAYLVSLGVSNTRVTTQVKTTEIGIVPKSTGSQPTSASTVTVTNSAGTGSGSGGGGTTVTTISVAAIAGVTAPVTGATRVTTTTAGTGYTGTVTWSPSAGTTFASATTYTATITLTPTSGYTLTGVAANFFTVAGATSDTNSADSGVITAVFPATTTSCAAGGICAVGDTGPGGGKVFYVHATTFTCGPTLGDSCKYLEAAPTTGTSAWTDVTTYAWSGNTTGSSSTVTISQANPAVVTKTSHGLIAGQPVSFTTSGTLPAGLTATVVYYVTAPTANTFNLANSYANATAGTPTKIATTTAGSGTQTMGVVLADALATAVGTGYKNTLAIVAQSATASKAGTIAQAYRGPNALSDWYLPSKNELNEMCKWARAVAPVSDATVCNSGTLNLGTGYGSGAAGFQANNYWSSSEKYHEKGWSHYFPGPGQGDNSKSNGYSVRPIRAFAPPT
jgi:hypothetical protein